MVMKGFLINRFATNEVFDEIGATTALFNGQYWDCLGLTSVNFSIATLMPPLLA